MAEAHFKPAWWLPSSHLQTLWPTLCRRPIKHLTFKRERIELPDGDFIDLDWVDRHQTGPIVLLLHGLEGTLNSPYAKGMLNAIQREGWRGIFLSFRGCSGEHNRLPRSYHSGDTADVDYVVELLKQREPSTPMAAVGFSLGGNVLVKWLGETAHNNPLQAAVAICVPFELYKAVLRINRGFSRVYQWHLLSCLRNKLKGKAKMLSSPISTQQLNKVRTIHDFDEYVTAPLHGFANANDYYVKCSSRAYLPYILRPTLLVQAKDDPFMTEDVLPNEKELSPLVQLELTDKGGHVGFVSGKVPWQAEYWLEQRVPEFLRAYLK